MERIKSKIINTFKVVKRLNFLYKEDYLTKKTFIYYKYVFEQGLKVHGIRYDQSHIHKILYFAKAYSFHKGTPTDFAILRFSPSKVGPVEPNAYNDIVFKNYSSLYCYISDDFTEYSLPMDASEVKSIDYMIQLMGDVPSYVLTSICISDVFSSYKTPWGKAIDKYGESRLDKYSNDEIKYKDMVEFYNIEWFASFEYYKDEVLRQTDEII